MKMIKINIKLSFIIGIITTIGLAGIQNVQAADPLYLPVIYTESIFTMDGDPTDEGYAPAGWFFISAYNPDTASGVGYFLLKLLYSSTFMIILFDLSQLSNFPSMTQFQMHIGFDNNGDADFQGTNHEQYILASYMDDVFECKDSYYDSDLHDYLDDVENDVMGGYDLDSSILELKMNINRTTAEGDFYVNCTESLGMMFWISYYAPSQISATSNAPHYFELTFSTQSGTPDIDSFNPYLLGVLAVTTWLVLMKVTKRKIKHYKSSQMM